MGGRGPGEESGTSCTSSDDGFEIATVPGEGETKRNCSMGDGRDLRESGCFTGTASKRESVDWQEPSGAAARDVAAWEFVEE